ncbi:hypothetical protein [Pseudaeromonas paramecii]|uniref:Uncharacterized protein n=1 Tax=Pseudaeromonas paramecii TaxID=2138166 RepID=A0ABP8Q0H2_9GAMM
MIFDKHKELAQKYHVDDIASALVPSTSISNFLGELETSKISMMSRRFLAKNKFIALERFANGTINFDEYELLAKQEKVIRIMTIEKEKQEEAARKEKFQLELKAKYELQRKIERERQKALEKDPNYIRKQKLIKLKQKYDLDFYIEKNDYNRLMSLIDKIDKGHRITPEDIVWLTLSRDDLYRGYFTDSLNKKHHKNEAEHIIKEYEVKNDHWLAVNASSHYRKACEPKSAISILSKIKLDSITNKKLKSAICTTHGGALRDIAEWTNAISLGETAFSFTPDNFRPCTLLGAIYMETSHFELGQEWYRKAIDRGFSEKSVDDEIKSIFKKADENQKEALRNYLLKLDGHRYRWVNDKKL